MRTGESNSPHPALGIDHGGKRGGLLGDERERLGERVGRV